MIKCKPRTRKNNKKVPWRPRGHRLIPPHKIIRSKKTYNRKIEKQIPYLDF